MNRAFKGIWIPREIWLDKELSWIEKFLLVEIESLDNEKGCWASNDYFASFFGVSKDRISKLISGLNKKGYITVELIYKKGTKAVEKRVVKINDGYRYKQLEGIGENNYTPIGENAEDNNTSFNNTSNKAIDEKQALRTRFDNLWIFYPLKKGKESAFKSYQKAIKDGAKDLDILNGIKRYNQEIKLKGTKKEYIAYGSTWFSQRRWSDEYENDNNQQNQPTKLQKANEVNWEEIYGKNL